MIFKPKKAASKGNEKDKYERSGQQACSVSVTKPSCGKQANSQVGRDGELGKPAHRTGSVKTSPARKMPTATNPSMQDTTHHAASWIKSIPHAENGNPITPSQIAPIAIKTRKTLRKMPSRKTPKASTVKGAPPRLRRC